MYSLVNRVAPNFQAAAVLGDNTFADQFDLHQAIEGKYAVLFFYPLDFTFVCPTELIAFNQSYEAFKQRNTEVIAVSIDSQFSHLKWKNTPVREGGIGQVQYPMVADVSHNIARNYGVEHAQAHVAYRATFIIDPNKVIRTLSIHDLPIGRNVDEMIRLVDAIQFHEKHGEVCPANWESGQSGMKPTHEGLKAYCDAEAAE